MKYQKRRYWKYRVYEDVSFQTDVLPQAPVDEEFFALDMNGLLTAKKGYVWDGASGPTIDTKNTMLGSLWHDLLYQLMRGKFINRNYRKRADEILRDVLIAEGMSKFRARTWYRAVRKLAAKSSKYNVITV